MSESDVTNLELLRSVPTGLIALTPGTLERSSARGVYEMLESMERAAAAAIEGGVRALMVREPSLEDGAFLELAQRVRARLDAAAPGEGWLCVHDRLHLAEAAKADAVHLGGTSLPLAAARSVVGASVPIGVSTHGDDGVDYGGADFQLHAQTFAPTSKPLHGRTVLGWDVVEGLAAVTDQPVFALGGVTAERLQERVAASSSSSLAGVALIGGLWGTDSAPISDSSGPLREVARISRTAAQLVQLSQALFCQQGRATS